MYSGNVSFALHKWLIFGTIWPEKYMQKILKTSTTTTWDVFSDTICNRKHVIHDIENIRIWPLHWANTTRIEGQQWERAMCIAFFCIARCRPERFVVLKHQWYLGNNTSLDPDLIHDDLILDTDWYLYLTIHVMWQGSWVPMIFENHQSIYFWPLKYTIENHLKLHYSQ